MQGICKNRAPSGRSDDSQGKERFRALQNPARSTGASSSRRRRRYSVRSFRPPSAEERQVERTEQGSFIQRFLGRKQILPALRRDIQHGERHLLREKSFGSVYRRIYFKFIQNRFSFAGLYTADIPPYRVKPKTGSFSIYAACRKIARRESCVRRKRLSACGAAVKRGNPLRYEAARPKPCRLWRKHTDAPAA